MRVDKVIVKAALSTLAAIAVLCVFLIAVLCLVFPQTMMQITYDMGMDGASIHFASVAYDRSGETYYVGFATDVAIMANYDDDTEEYGEKLLLDDGFEEYAKSRITGDLTVEDFRRYIQGEVCIAKYDQGKKDAAVEKAFEYIGQSFPIDYNPAAKVYLKALSAGDQTTVEKALIKMNALQVYDEEAVYLSSLINLAS